MLTPRAKIAGIPQEDQKWTADSLRQQIFSNMLRGRMKEIATQWATRRLLAGRIGEARSVMRTVIELEDGTPDDLQRRLDMQSCKVSRWEYQTALEGGDLSLGILLHTLHNTDCDRIGMEKVKIHSRQFVRCGNQCIEKSDFHNAIAAYERANSTTDLIDLADILEGAEINDDETRSFAKLARDVAQELQQKIDD